MFNGFYRGKTVLVTGHTGFKGGWLALWLHHLGATVWGLGLEAPTHPNLHEVVRSQIFAKEITADVRDLKKVERALVRARPDIIFHLAAQPLVRRSYTHPLETLATNALGTANLLEAVCHAGLPCAVVVITSDKCYANRGGGPDFRETDPLGGDDVYSMSKAATELVVQSWRQSFFRTNPQLGNVATARAGNVIGGGDYAADRLVPDCVRALLAQRPIPVRNPGATRPWQHVLDCLSGYLWLGARLAQTEKNSPLAGAFNFGPGPAGSLPVSELVREILRHWPGEWQSVEGPECPREAARLQLDIDKAAALLQWRPVWDFRQAVAQTVAWYSQRHVARHPDLAAFSLGQIEEFTAAARKQPAVWTAPAGA